MKQKISCHEQKPLSEIQYYQAKGNENILFFFSWSTLLSEQRMADQWHRVSFGKVKDEVKLTAIIISVAAVRHPQYVISCLALPCWPKSQSVIINLE